jgi:hypothetical protein
MYTSFDTHLPAVVETGLARVPSMARGWIHADDAALARRMAPC